jgi:NAD(P)H-dependent flavin oxidoreductase YrpB (nitropropane dioxygenase family)
LTGPIRQAAAKSDDVEFQSLWAGRSYANTRSMPVADLMQTLGEEMKDSK